MPFQHDPRFSEAFANTPHRVYGKRLLPFSLWHQLLLEHAQSPVFEGKGCTPADLLLAARLCSTPWNPSFVFPDLSLPGSTRLLVASVGHPFLRELRKFGTYLQDYCSGPKLWESDSSGGSSRDIDGILETAVYLTKATTLSWSEVWTYPVGVLEWISLSAQKLDGAEVNIWTPDDEIRFTQFKADRERKLDEEGRRISDETGTPYEAARKKAHDEYWERQRKAKGVAAMAKAAGRGR